MMILTNLLLLFFLKGCLSAPADLKRVLFSGPGGSFSPEFNMNSSGSMGFLGPGNFVTPTGFGGGGFLSGFNPYPHMSGEVGGAIGGGHQMCMPISQTCPIKCPYGYTTNPMGCEECHCKAAHTVKELVCPYDSKFGARTLVSKRRCYSEEHTTHENKTTDDANIHLQLTTQVNRATDHANTVTKDAVTTSPIAVTNVDTTCQDAKTLCNLKCSGSGYLVDPNDCTYCVCKSDLLTPSGR